MCVSWLFNKIVLYSLPKGLCITFNMPSYMICDEKVESGCTLFLGIIDVTWTGTLAGTYLSSHLFFLVTLVSLCFDIDKFLYNIF